MIWECFFSYKHISAYKVLAVAKALGSNRTDDALNALNKKKI